MLRARPGEERVEAIVAMRDEERNAAGFLAAALAAPAISRIVVVDDASRDGTRAILDRCAAADPRVAVLASDGSGKNAALALGARGSQAAWLLFLDADVRIDPSAPQALIAFARERGADAASAWPRVQITSFGGMLLAPIVTYVLLQFLPMRLARTNNVEASAGNGQCFLVSRGAYERCGGHAAISAIVEDVALARALKRSGSRVALGSIAALASVRSYDSFTQAIAGSARSLYFGAGMAGCVLAACWLLLMSLAPLPLYAARLATAARMREPWTSVVLAPLGTLAGALAALYALFAGARGTLRWRGRTLRGSDGP